MGFAERYGPWAVIAGASEGTGSAFALRIAAEGVNCVLIARRQPPLDALADELRATYSIECVTASVDLAAPDAADRVAAAAGDREIGLFVSNAGSDPNGQRFLDNALSNWDDLVQRNVMTMMRCAYHFGQAMRARKRGGLLLVNSGACYGGASYLAAYSASKAFTLNFAEGLWAELRPHGVDVLTLVMHQTDTPAYRQLLAEKNMPLPTNWADPDDVARLGLERLALGPIQNWALADDDPGYAGFSAAQRRARVEMIDQMSKHTFGDA